MTIYTIYRATNTVTGKIYIGFTSTLLKKRVYRHKLHALKYKCNNKFYKAIRQFGWESFVFEPIYQAKEYTPPKQSHTFQIMENYFINEYDSIRNGYNSVKGGGSFPILKGSAHPLWSVGHTEQAIQKIKDNHHDVTGANNPKAVRAIIITPNGELIKAHGNLLQISLDLGLNKHSLYNILIKGNHIGKRGKAKGFQIYRDEDYVNSALTKTTISALLKDDVEVRLQTLNKVLTCYNCGFTATRGNITRWHNKNCKFISAYSS